MRMWLAVVALAWASSGMAAGNIANSLHNLSTSGPGEFRSRTEDRICVFCHIPHTYSPDAPMWNRPAGGSQIYRGIGQEGTSPQAGASSALCLSCHDGTIALGNMRAGAKTRSSDLSHVFLRGRANLGTDLSDDHPISVRQHASSKTAGFGLISPSGVDLPLENGEVQCGSCHDAHDDSDPPFLHRSTQDGELCLTCHQVSGGSWDWLDSAHAVSSASPRGGNPWPERKPSWRGQNVRGNACMNCHVSHNASTPRGLVTEVEERACFRCHDGTVAWGNVRGDQQKFFRHPVEITPNSDHDHDALGSTRLHVECGDCHNPHAARSDVPLISFNPANPSGDRWRAPLVNGSLVGVSGLSIQGSMKAEADFEYEVCLKCHGVPGRSACGNRRCSTATRYNMARQDGTYNLREKLDPGSPSLLSYHPVVSNNPANNSEVPSLREDIPIGRISGQMYCSDCHNSDQSPAAGGSGPGGPHGSRHEGILALPYEFSSRSGQGRSFDGLCMKCHDPVSLYANDSFLHREHVLEAGTSCINCHDPHGSAANPHLINFLTQSTASGDLTGITGVDGFGEPVWEDNGRYSGTCYLSCHGTLHDGESY